MDDEMYISGSPALCLHCGKMTMLRIRAQYIYETDEKEEKRIRYVENVKWSVLQCPECLNPILIQSNESRMKENFGGWKTTLGSIKTLYPFEKQIPSNLPETVRKMYAEAAKVQMISPSSCAVLVRRT